MQFRFGRAIAGPVTRRQRFVEDRKGAFDIAGASFGLGQCDLDVARRRVGNVLLVEGLLDAAAHVREPVAGRAAFNPRPALEEDPKRSPKWQFVLARKPGEFDGVRRGARLVAAHQFEHHRVKSLRRDHSIADMREARGPRLSASDEGGRTIDLAQRPQSEREVPHRRDAGVVSEPERQIVVAPGLRS